MRRSNQPYRLVFVTRFQAPRAVVTPPLRLFCRRGYANDAVVGVYLAITPSSLLPPRPPMPLPFVAMSFLASDGETPSCRR